MSTLYYCDTDDCNNSDHCYDKGIYPLGVGVGDKLVKNKWIYSKYDTHICRHCLNTYYNEEDEQLKEVDGYIELGKDFKDNQ